MRDVMRAILRSTLLCIFLVSGLLSGAAMASAQDAALVSPNNFKLEIDNPWVRVLRLKQGPHEKTPIFESPASVTVYLTEADQKIMVPGGKSQEMKRKLGEASYADAGKHSL